MKENQRENNKKNILGKQLLAGKDKIRRNHISDFTSSKETGEDATQYGEFISSFFGWISPEDQKEEAEKLEDITKNEK